MRRRAETEKFAEIPYTLGDLGVPLLHDALAILECRMVKRYPGGNHSIFMGEVMSVCVQEHVEPLLFFRSNYNRLHNNSATTLGMAHMSHPW